MEHSAPSRAPSFLVWLNRLPDWQFTVTLYLLRWAIVLPLGLLLSPHAASADKFHASGNPLSYLLPFLVVAPTLETFFECMLPCWVMYGLLRLQVPPVCRLFACNGPMHAANTVFNESVLMSSCWPHAVAPLVLAKGEAHAWAVPLAVDQPMRDEMWATLAPDELNRASEFYFDEPRRRFVIARGMLRKLLAGYLNVQPADIELTSDQNGKPRLDARHFASHLNFNVSHSGDLALVVVAAECEVGVDVEQVREVGHVEQIARRFFHPLETAAILATPAAARNEAFLRCWTGKEAVLKAFGTGITGQLADFQVPLGETFEGCVELAVGSPRQPRARCWLQPLNPCDGYVAAMACIECQRVVRCFQYSG